MNFNEFGQKSSWFYALQQDVRWSVGALQIYYSPKHGTPAEEDAWWETFKKDADELSAKYDKEPLIRALVMCLSDEFERKFKTKSEETKWK